MKKHAGNSDWVDQFWEKMNDDDRYLRVSLGIMVYVVTYAIQLILIVVPEWNHSIPLFGSELSIIGGIFIAQVLYLCGSSYIISAEEMVVIYLFGKEFTQRSSGFLWAPRFFFTIERFTIVEQKDEYPGTKDQVVEMEDIKGGVLPEGKVLPMIVTCGRATGKAGETDGENDAINRRMAVEVRAICRFKITNGIDFKKNIGGDMKELKDQIRSAVEAKIAIEFALKTPAEILNDLEGINDRLKKTVEDLIADNGNWGVEVIKVQILEVNLGKKVNDALEGVTNTQLEANSTVITAEANGKATEIAAFAEKIKIREEGTGTASATKAIGTAEAKVIYEKLIAESNGLKEMMGGLDIKGPAMIAAITAQKVAGHGNMTYLGSKGFTDLLGIAKVMQESASVA